jgi:hypothetical protein
VTRPPRLAASDPHLAAQAELLESPLAKIDNPLTRDTMDGGDWTALDDRGERRPVRVVEPGRLPRRLRWMETIRSKGVELDHPEAGGRNSWPRLIF